MKKPVLLALVGVILLNANLALPQDGFYVIPIRATPGTSINRLPYTITAPGYYYLTGNLSSTSGNGITITSDHVTLDLMGFNLKGPNNSIGILMTGATNVEIRNGTITGWNYGIWRAGNNPGNNQRVTGVRAVGNTLGIFLGYNALIKDCTVTESSFAAGYAALGVDSGTISGCTVYNFTLPQPELGCVYIGPVGGTASDNVVINCATKGIRGHGPTTISNNVVINCSTGISNEGGGSITGNAVKANAGQTGIAPATNTTPSATPSLLDQNSVNGDGTHYGSGNNATVMGLNSP